jgi:4-amino-4-deoxy-L-arabinose transferase-like glycosyltransferase
MAWLTDRRLLTAALAAWGVVAVIGLVLGPSLGHDEAAFALAARGEAPPGRWLYRSEGTIAIARIGVALGGATWQLRLGSALLSPLVIVAVYAVGRAAFSARTGAWAAVVLAGAHPMGLRSAELLSDLPAAACLLGGVALLVGELDRRSPIAGGGDPDGSAGGAGDKAPRGIDRVDGPRWRLVLAGPVFAAAFYLRYGSAPVIAFAIAVAGAMWWRAVLRRPLRVLAMGAVLAGLVVPHLLYSRAVTGTLLGILEVSAGMPRRAYVGEGLVTYLTRNPLLFYGFLVAPVMIAGLAGLVRLRHRAAWYLAIVALGQIVSLGIQSHGQPRYVFFATALLVVLGVEVLARSRLARPRVALALALASWLGVAIAAPIYYRYLDDTRAPIVAAGQAIRASSGGRPCAVVALIAPQLMWHSGCEVHPSGLLQDPLPADRDRYAASFTSWPIELEPILAAQRLQAVPIPTPDPRAQVWRLH